MHMSYGVVSNCWFMDVAASNTKSRFSWNRQIYALHITLKFLLGPGNFLNTAYLLAERLTHTDTYII
jgi:hypothetical protein